MNTLPVSPITPEQQQKLLGQIYLLLGKQAQSYHKRHHMGSNTSVPAELAQNLMESVEYTVLKAGGFGIHRTAEEALQAGQQILNEKLSHARNMLRLINATSPQWQTECRWDTLRYLTVYLEKYDLLHLAHKGPDALFYPILTALPEGTQGIDEALFYLKVLCTENQIMAFFPKASLDTLWNRLPVATLNQCQQVLVNSIGKSIIGADPKGLVFTTEEHMTLLDKLFTTSEKDLQTAASRMCKKMGICDTETTSYVRTIIPQVQMWTGESARYCSLENVFL